MITQPDEFDWVQGTDEGTGVRFKLPGTATIEKRPGPDGTPDERRTYRFTVRGGPEIVVAIVDSAATIDELKTMPEQLASGLRDGGAPDAKIIEQVAVDHHGHPAVDFQVSFTSKKETKSIWFARYVTTGDAVVLVQTISFVETVDEATVTVWREYHRRTVEALEVP